MVGGGANVQSQFSAPGPALGYLAQVDYALLAMLGHLDDEEAFSVSIETLDDIVFHHAETDDPTEKWQSKHSIDGSRSLSDASSDLWKTIHNWIAEPSDDGVRLVLLSTCPAGPIASKLRVGEGRNIGHALIGLERVAQESQNDANKPYYAAFLSLSQSDRQAMLQRVEVIDGAAGSADIHDQLIRAVRKSVGARRREALIQRLRGWWHGRVIAHLDSVANRRHDRITAAELEGHLLDIAETLRDENLPIDVWDMDEPTEDEITDDDRVFVAQLRLVAMHSRRVRKCILDHNRAFAQRSIWQREQLLQVGELGRYDRELIEAWERFFLPLSEEEDEFTDEEVRRRARERFGQLGQSDLVPIRRDVRAGFIAHGSLHIIADRLEIGWHPQWLAHLRHRLAEVRDLSEQHSA